MINLAAAVRGNGYFEPLAAVYEDETVIIEPETTRAEQPKSPVRSIHT